MSHFPPSEPPHHPSGHHGAGTRSKNALHGSGIYGHSSSTRMMMTGSKTSHAFNASHVGVALTKSMATVGAGGGVNASGVSVVASGALPGTGPVGVAGGVGYIAPVQVLDDEGNDVTPMPLLAVMKGTHGGRSTVGVADMSMSTVMKETVADVLNNLESMTMGSWSNSAFGRSNHSFSNSSRASGASSPEDRDDDASSIASGDMNDDKDYVNSNTRRSSSVYSPTHSRSHNTNSTTKTIDPTQPIHIRLTETPTMTFIDLPAVAVSNEYSDELTATRLSNQKYTDLCATRANNDNYTERAMQTFHFALKNKDVQASGPSFASQECMATNWAIYDAYQALEDSAEGHKDAEHGDHPPSDSQPSADHTNIDPSAIDASIQIGTDNPAHSGTIMAGSHSVFMSDDGGGSEANYSMMGGSSTADHHQSHSTENEREVVSVNGLNQEALRNSLMFVERAVVMNNYEPKMLVYRNIDLDQHLDQPTGSNLNLVEQAEGAPTANNNGEPEDPSAPSNEVSEGAPNASPGAEGEEDPTSTDPANDDPNTNALDDPTSTTPEPKDTEEEEDQTSTTPPLVSIPTLASLWSYRCELTRGRTVTCMAWNKSNEDILAVGYAECKLGALGSREASTGGLVVCWSLKNPEWPERVYRTPVPPTSLDFSRSTPNLLALGFSNGLIAIYDVRKKTELPVLDNADHPLKHREAVWDLKWVGKEQGVGGEGEGRGEVVVSTSTDGRVCQWVMKKGLEGMDLMVLKQVTRQEKKGGAGSAGQGGMAGAATGSGGAAASGGRTGTFISRQSGGLCFDFNPRDSNIYLVGTEDGHIHKCSCSYNEQYLSTQYGHTGPIYKVKWSPFLSNYFLSCSADWTIRLWGSEEEEETFKFQSGKDTVTDVAWSPTSSTIFGAVSNDGRLEIWDLQYSVLDPVILHTVLDRQLTTITFGSKSSIILTGDDNGSVNVYSLRQNTISALPGGHHQENVPKATAGPGFAVGGVGLEGGREAEYEAWYEKQMEQLMEVILSKNQKGGSGAAVAGTNNNAVGSAGSPGAAGPL
ncbi:WD repeat-containing protein 78 [Chytridiales sp. JEL 0842]|nr:WD repeat-containing protein 78 [Chytridiales sp. JEL 0842]